MNAWLFDLYPLGEEMILWFIGEDGRRLRLRDRFEPIFFVEAAEKGLGGGASADEAPGGRAALAALCRSVQASRAFAYRGPAERRDIWTGRPRQLESIALRDLEGAKPALARLHRRFPDLLYYNCDLPVGALYCYERGVFPMGRCEVEEGEGGRLAALQSVDDPWALDYALPPLREATLRAEGLRLRPRPRIGRLSLETADRTVTWEDDDPRLILEDLNRVLALDDPDLIWTEGGDGAIMPLLFTLAQRLGVAPALDREPGMRRRIVTEGRTVDSYGRRYYMAPDYPLFGRWHIDRYNSFWTGATGFDGFVEIVRHCKLPPQRTARRSIGTGLTSLQCEAAYKAGYLIPWKKTQVEDWKSALHLARSDRGGLVFQPIVGVHEDVVEIDFASMFPNIMFRRKVSPELINCACCSNAAVPGLGYTICERREGLVSGVLRPIVEKRARYKALRAAAAAAGDEEARVRYNSRQEAFKWVLVCCFGYLGYRNARFGRIEAHESTTAFARELLLQSKEVVEERGYRILHANVDCFWMQRPGLTDEAVEAMRLAVEERTQLPLAVEGRYAWIVFLPSRQDPRRPVPNRYFGRFVDGTFKYRGIELRRGDVCPLVKSLQRALLDELAACATPAACRERLPRLEALVDDEAARLRAGDVAMEELAIKQQLSRAAEAYRGNSRAAVAARQARDAGIAFEPGQSAYYVVVNDQHPLPMERLRLLLLLSPDDSYDAAFYERLLRDAARTLLAPFEEEGAGVTAAGRAGAASQRAAAQMSLPLSGL